MSGFSIDLKTPVNSLGSGSVDCAARDRSSHTPKNGQSWVCGSAEIPLWRKTVWQVLQEAASAHGSRDAAVFSATGTRWSWSELLRRVDDLAAGLLVLGLQSGDRLGIWSPNNEQWLLTQFATARIGVILVTINPAYRVSELEYALNKSGARALILADHFKSSDYIAILQELIPELANNTDLSGVRSARLKDLQHVIHLSQASVPGMHCFDQLFAMAGPATRLRLDALTRALDTDDPINIQFTSGTTGSPKGATLSHRNIVNNARFTVERLQLNERDRLCIPVPLYHCFGMVMGVLGCACTGACMVFPGEGFDPVLTLQSVDSERCTALYGVPAMFVTMLESKHFEKTNVTSLRTGVMAGAPCPEPVMRRVVEQMHMREITIAYGMTETSPVSFQSHIDDPLQCRVTTVGRIHPHTEVKIVGSNGRVLPVGEQGELLTRGYLVMRGYWRDDALTAQSIDAAGWMHTGDLAVLDAQGYCSITGRLKDMIIRGGENISPREVEEFLLSHPAVIQAQVFGVPDKKLGERVCAWLVLREDEKLTLDQLRSYCHNRIAHYKVPESLRVCEELPMTVTGKPQKYVMREAMIAELASE